MGHHSAPKKKKVKMDARRIFVGMLALVMVLALLLPLISSAFLSAQAVTQDDLKNQISGLKSDANAAAVKKKELQEQLRKIENDKATAMERKQILDQQLAAIDSQVANTQSQIDTYTALIAEQEVALAEAQEREQEAYEQFCRRARAMEEAGDISYWSVLFAASDYSDLLDRLALVDEIMTYDNYVVEDLAAARQEVEETLAGLNETKSGLDDQKAQLDIQRAEQAEKVAEAEALLDELKDQADTARALEEAAEAEQRKIDAEIAAREKELQAMVAAANFTTGSGYYYPLPSSNVTVTSRFGYRICPFHGREYHTGADIAAPLNTPVYAVQGGVVTISAYAPSSYGNYVLVDHGNGRTTLYAHMNSRAVSVGDVVSQGQVVGYVGHTGSATGNHLHLELKVNGVRQDALAMYPAVNFVYR